MLGVFPVGTTSIGQIYRLIGNEMTAYLMASSLLSGVPQSDYKTRLADTRTRRVYTALIAPWTVTDRNS